METNTVPLDTIQLHSTGWTVKVLLMEKSAKRTPIHGGKVYQRYIFADAQESKIQGVSYAPDTAIVDKVLLPFKTHFIENAKVCRSNPTHRIVDNPIQLVLTASTVMEVDETHPFTATLGQPCFTTFAALTQFWGLSTYIALVIDRSEPKAVKYASGNAQVQDLILINEEKTDKDVGSNSPTLPDGPVNPKPTTKISTRSPSIPQKIRKPPKSSRGLEASLTCTYHVGEDWSES